MLFLGLADLVYLVFRVKGCSLELLFSLLGLEGMKREGPGPSQGLKILGGIAVLWWA